MSLKLFFAVFGSLLPYLIPWPLIQQHGAPSTQDPPDEVHILPIEPKDDGDGVTRLKGIVQWTQNDKPKPREPIDQSADPKCLQIQGGKRIGTEDSKVVVGRVQNVMIYVSKGLDPAKKYPAPEQKIVLNQKGCTYEPHVLSIRAGQPLTILNSDATLHNIHGLAQVNPEFNFGQPTPGLSKEIKFNKPEIFKVKCDVHPWMNAWIGVFDHPFHTASNEKGEYAILGLPPGAYEITAWHEVYGKFKQQVTITEGNTTEADFTLDWSNAKK